MPPARIDQLRLDFSLDVPVWLRPDKSFYWRRDKLQEASEAYGRSFIVYRSGEYGASLEVSRQMREAFYAQHIDACIWLGMEHLRIAA